MNKRKPLSTAALLLVALSTVAAPVFAQEDDKPKVKLRPPPTGPRSLIQDRLKKGAKDRPVPSRARRSRPAGGTATPSTKPGSTSGNAGDANSGGTDTTMRQDPDGPDVGNIKPFETGVEYKPTSPRSRVTFNLEDADLTDLVRLISSITGRRFILSGKSRTLKATVYAPTKVTAAEAYRAFLAILEMNGLTVVPSGRYLKIAEATNVEKEPIGTYVDPNARLPRDERFITRLHRLESVSAEDVTNLLGKFSSKHGQITAYAPTNTLIITDTGVNIRRMMRIVQEIDVSRTGTQMWIEPIHHANAVEIAERLTELFPAATGSPSDGKKAKATTKGAGANTSTVGKAGAAKLTKILPDERTNSLIIIAAERAYLRILEMIRQLDVPLEGSGGIHVHYLQHGDSEEISQTLSSLVSGSGGAGGGSRRGNRGGQNANANTAAGTSTTMFEGDIAITAHKPSNALVITSSLHDYAALKRVIDRLDAPRRQVFIEAVVMELEVNRSRTLGIDFHTGVPDPVGEGSLGVIGSQRIGGLAGTAGLLSPDGISGLAVGVQGPILDELTEVIGISVPSFGATLTALSTASDANILSTPHIIAMDNEEAEINIGQNVPLQTNATGFGALGNLGALAGAAGQNANQLGQAASLLGGGFGGGGFNAPRQDVGTKLTITPHINESDQIRLEINEEISEAGSSPQGTLGAISLNRRTAKTQAVVADQETLVIGGLMRERIATSEDKVPILGDIPLLGTLFRRTTETKQKTNLLLFLTPYIVRDSSDLRRIYERKIRERQEFLDRYLVFSNTDYEPPMDYSRTRGLVAEIIREVEDISIQEALAAEAAGQPPLDHIPRAPVGGAEIFADDNNEQGNVVITPDGEVSSELLTPIESEPQATDDD